MRLFSDFLLIYAHQDLLHVLHPAFFINSSACNCARNLFMNKHNQIEVYSENNFVFQNVLKDEAAL